MGRPASAVVPQVLNQGNAAMGLGCCGARAYIKELDDHVALWALPGAKLEQYCEQTKKLVAANKFLSVFHQSRQPDVVAGKRPSVQETLEYL